MYVGVLRQKGLDTVCFTVLDQNREMIIFKLILTTFEASFIFEAAVAEVKIGSSFKIKPPLVN